MKVYNDHILLFTTFSDPQIFTLEIETKELKEVISPALLGGIYLIDAVIDNEGNFLVVGSTKETVQKALIRKFNSNGSIISNSSHIGNVSYGLEGDEKSSSRLTKIKVNENNDYVVSGFSYNNGRKIPIVSFKVGSVENIITLNDRYVIDFIIIDQYFYVFTGGSKENTFTVNKYEMSNKLKCLCSATFTAMDYKFDGYGVLAYTEALFKGNDDSLILIVNTSRTELPHAFKFSYDLTLIDDAVVCEPLKLSRTLNT